MSSVDHVDQVLQVEKEQSDDKLIWVSPMQTNQNLPHQSSVDHEDQVLQVEKNQSGDKLMWISPMQTDQNLPHHL